jgi:hypothetical protein
MSRQPSDVPDEVLGVLHVLRGAVQVEFGGAPVHAHLAHQRSLPVLHRRVGQNLGGLQVERGKVQRGGGPVRQGGPHDPPVHALGRLQVAFQPRFGGKRVRFQPPVRSHEGPVGGGPRVRVLRRVNVQVDQSGDHKFQRRVELDVVQVQP